MTTTTRTILSQYNTTLTTYQTDANSYNTLITIIDEDLTLSEKDDQNYTTYKTNVQNAIAAINGLQQYSIDSTVNYELTQQMKADLNTIEINFSEIETNFRSLNSYYTNKISARFKTLRPAYQTKDPTTYTNSNINPLLCSYENDETKTDDIYWSNDDISSTNYNHINDIYYPSTYDSYSSNFNNLMIDLNDQYTLDYTFSKTIKEVFTGTTSTDPKYININIYPEIWSTSITNIDNTLNQYLKPRTTDKTRFTTMGAGSFTTYYMTGYFYTQNIYIKTTDLIDTNLTAETGTDVAAQLQKLNNAINYLNTVHNKIADILLKIKNTSKVISDTSDGIRDSNIYKYYIKTYETTFLKNDLYIPFNNSDEDKNKIARYYTDSNVSDYKRIIIYLFSAYFSEEPLNRKTNLQLALSEIIKSKFTITNHAQEYKVDGNDGKSPRIVKATGSGSSSKKKYCPIYDMWYNPTQANPAGYPAYPTISDNSYYNQDSNDPLISNNTFHNQIFMWKLADPTANLTLFLRVPKTSSTYNSVYSSVNGNKTNITRNYPNIDEMVYVKKCNPVITSTNTDPNSGIITTTTQTLTYTSCPGELYYLTTRVDTQNSTKITTTITVTKSNYTDYSAINITAVTARNIVTVPIECAPGLDSNGNPLTVDDWVVTAVDYNWDIFYNFKNYKSAESYTDGSLNEYWTNAMCYINSGYKGIQGGFLSEDIQRWLIHSNSDSISRKFPRLLDIMDVVVTNEKKLFVPLINSLNYYLYDNKYDIISYNPSTYTLTYSNIQMELDSSNILTYTNTSSEEKYAIVNPPLTTSTNYYSISMEDIILMLKMININKNDLIIQSQNLHKNISYELTNLLNLASVPITYFNDTSNNNTSTPVRNIGNIVESLIFKDIGNTIENANTLTNKSTVDNAYEIESNTTYSTYLNYQTGITNGYDNLYKVTLNNYKIYIKLRTFRDESWYDNASDATANVYYHDTTLETQEAAVTNEPISGIAYLTSDYTANGTLLETYTIEHLNKALQAAFRSLKCYYIDSRPYTDPSLDPNYDLYTVRNMTTNQLYSYFAYFAPSVGATPFKLITKVIGQEGTHSEYLTKPDGWKYTPFKAYNPVITVNGGLEGLLGLCTITYKTTTTYYTKDSTFIKEKKSSHTDYYDGEKWTYMSYKLPTFDTSFSTEPATKTETITTTTTTYKSLSTDEHYKEAGSDMVRNSSLSQDVIINATLTSYNTFLEQMQGYQNTMVNCSIITTEIDFATGITTIDSEFINIRATLNSALAGYSSNTTVSSALASLDTFYRDYTAIPTGKTTNMVTDATTILTRYSPITTLNNLTYISDIFDTSETTVPTVISIDPEISFIDRIKSRCDEMKSLAENFYNLSEALTSTINPFIQYLIDFLVNETNIMKVDIDNKYNSLSSSDPNKANALTTKTTVDNYYTTSSTLATGFGESLTKTADLTTIKNNFNTTLNTLEPEMDGHLKSSIDRSLIPAMQTIQENVNTTYQTISAQDPANAHLTEATALNDDVNTRVTNTLAIQSGWSASITKISDYLEVKNNYASIQLDQQQINTYV